MLEFLTKFAKEDLALRDQKPHKDLTRHAISVESSQHVKLIRLTALAKENILSKAVIDRLQNELSANAYRQELIKLAVITNGVAEDHQRVFSLGDDPSIMTQRLPDGSVDHDAIAAYYKAQYLLLHEIYTALRALSVVDGIAVGSGAGLAMASLFTLATNTSTMVARNPESFHVNGGVLGCLTTLEPSLARYWALTGEPLKGADLFYAGLANVYVPYECLGQLFERLDDLVMFKAIALNGSLCEFMRLPPEEFSLKKEMPVIDRCFGNGKMCVEDIIVDLEKAGSGGSTFAKTTVKQLRGQSPLALKTVFKQLQYCWSKDGMPIPFQSVLEQNLPVEIASTERGHVSYNSLQDVSDDVVNTPFKLSKQLGFNFPAQKLSALAKSEQREQLGPILRIQLQREFQKSNSLPTLEGLLNTLESQGRTCVPGNLKLLGDALEQLHIHCNPVSGILERENDPAKII